MAKSLIPERCYGRRDFEEMFECATRAHGLYSIAYRNAPATAAQRVKLDRIEKAVRREAGGRRYRAAKGAEHRQRRPGGAGARGRLWRRSKDAAPRRRRIVR